MIAIYLDTYWQTFVAYDTKFHTMSIWYDTLEQCAQANKTTISEPFTNTRFGYTNPSSDLYIVTNTRFRHVGWTTK